MKDSPAVKFDVIHKTIQNDGNMLNISELCKIAGVSRAGFYKWIKSEKAKVIKEEQDKADFDLILTAYKHKGYDKGVRSIYMRLLHLNPPVVINLKKIRRLMHKFNLRCPIRKPNPYRKISKAMQTSRVAPNLLNREFRIHGARKVLLTDITYIPRYSHHKDGILKYTYVSVIMDAFTKEILSCVCSTSLEVDFVLQTVNLLIDNYNNELKTDVLIHSDQGCHYTATKFIDILKDFNIRQSMSRRGNCWDNAPQESLFGHMKDELKLLPSDAHHQIETKVLNWINYYNNERYQWRLAKLSPKEYYTYITTGEYPLPINVIFNGALPQAPEFTAFVSKKGDMQKDDT